MASISITGPLWGGTFSSSTITSSKGPQRRQHHHHHQQHFRRQTWVSATLETGQSLISGMLSSAASSKKDLDINQRHHHAQQYQTFRDEILMPPTYDSIVNPTPPVSLHVASPPPPPPTTRTKKTLAPPQPLPPPPQQQQQQQQQPSSSSSSARSSYQPLQLPPLPRLLGLENLDEWDDILRRTLRLHGLAEYITAPYPGVPEPPPPSPPPPRYRYSWKAGKYLAVDDANTTTTTRTREQWAADRAAVCLMMVGSFSSEVRDTLSAYGYDGAGDDGADGDDPKALHDLVLEALPRAAGEDVVGWMRELSSISPRRVAGGSLRDYCLRLQYLRRRLNQAEPQPNDNLVLVMAVLGLARSERHEALSMRLGEELERGNMTWARFMADLSAVHGREMRERKRGATARKQQQQQQQVVMPKDSVSQNGANR